MVQAAAKVMVEKKISNGSIINISSIAAKVYTDDKYVHVCMYVEIYDNLCMHTLVCTLWVQN